MFDYIVIGLYILSIIIGWKKGAIKVIYNFVAIFLALLISKMLYPSMRAVLDKIGVTSWINSGFENMFNFEVPKELTIYEKIAFIEELNLPSSLTNVLAENNNVEIYNRLGVDKFDEYIKAMLSYITLNILSVLCIFILSYIILVILGKMLHIVAKLPVINGINRTIGAFLQGLIFTFYLLIFNLLLVATASFKSFEKIRIFVEDSFFTMPSRNIDLIADYVQKFFS